MPAELKIREIEEGIESYESKILYGSEIMTEKHSLGFITE